jgi:phytoene dehydrogenase-like protein
MGALGIALRHVAPPGRPVGGSGQLPEALGAALVATGGVVRTGTRVDRIACAGDRVVGVVVDGEVVPADVVVCAADPRTAIVDWLGRGAPARAQSLVRRWRTRAPGQGYESKLDAIVDVPPRYAYDEDRVVSVLGMDTGVPTTVITPPAGGISAARRDADAGAVAGQPVMLVNLPSVADPSMAVDGRHVLSLEVLFTPYHLAGGWADTVEPRRWLDVLAGHVQSGFLEHIREWRVVTPVDYEHDFGLPSGHAASFAGGPLAALVGRDRELTRYETPVRGLFLTGAGTFPGAGIWGTSGRNTATVVLRRLAAIRA